MVENSARGVLELEARKNVWHVARRVKNMVQSKRRQGYVELEKYFRSPAVHSKLLFWGGCPESGGRTNRTCPEASIACTSSAGLSSLCASLNF